MATFAEYPQQTMASNNNDDDFTLFPYIWTNDQSYLPATTYAEQSYINSTTFDSFPAQQAYAHPSQDQFSFNPEAFQHPKGTLQPPSPKYSPANSASHSFDFQNPPAPSYTSDSGASVQSTISSAMGSPMVQPQASNEWNQTQSMTMLPNIVHHDSLAQDMFATTDLDFKTIPVTDKAGCVDPSLIQPFSPTQYTGAQFQEIPAAQSPQNLHYAQAQSPAPMRNSTGKAPSPYMRTQSWQPYPAYPGSRRQSVSSVHSRHSQTGSVSSGDDSNKGLCPIPTCGRHVKDLKAHMLTHQNERPEKCPIPTCEYHTKGFARKYDKNRHTLTHYKGTMVCGFCPGSGSAAEKSFNRADVFKRHLTSVHGVEQTPPNARRKSPTTGTSKKAYGGARDVSGMCSTCGVTFASAQDFYEHLDDCVLRVVQQADPSEAINEKLLTSMADDVQVQETMEKHMLPNSFDLSASTSIDEDEEGEEEDDDEDDSNDATYGSRKPGKGSIKSRKGAAGVGNSSGQSTQSRVVSGPHAGIGNHITSGGAVSKPKGMTRSKNGVPLANPMSGKGSKRRKNYPLSWGAAPEKMKMKKRVLCVYDGPRRLWKDDMMLDADHEVRIPLPGVGDGRAWVTDLDVQTLRRAEGVLNATDEEKGPWIEDDAELERLMQ